jgi:hypothetical protein
MVPGLPGLHVVQHVVVDSNHVVNNIHAAVMTMYKNVHVTKTPVIINNGLNGPIVLFHVEAETWLDSVFTVVLVRFKPIPNSAIPIHVHIMVPGLTGLHAAPHVVLVQCPVCDTVTVVESVMVFVLVVTSPPTKLLNVKWETVVTLTGPAGLVVVETPVIKTSDSVSEVDVPVHQPKRSLSHATSPVLCPILAWSSFKIHMNSDFLPEDTIVHML